MGEAEHEPRKQDEIVTRLLTGAASRAWLSLSFRSRDEGAEANLQNPNQSQRDIKSCGLPVGLSCSFHRLGGRVSQANLAWPRCRVCNSAPSFFLFF